MSNVREALAAEAHEAWSGWMKYLFSKCEPGPDGTLIIPKWAVDRWQGQVAKPYAHLTDEEQESDREEADRYLSVMQKSTGGAASDEEARTHRGVGAAGSRTGGAH